MADPVFGSKQECLNAIALCNQLGAEPPASLLSQLKAFEDAENSDTPIWSSLQLHYPYGNGTMPAEKKECVESAVAQLLEDGPHADEPGLLLGKIQCGKTDTFEDIIGLSFDKGIDVAIVLTKGTKALVNQTIKRMNTDFIRFKPDMGRLDQRVAISVKDIMDISKRSGLDRPLVENGRKLVIVCKKNKINLDRLTDLFARKCPWLKDKKVLVVDDEADFASRNYRSVKQHIVRDEDGNVAPQVIEFELAKISQQIDDFRKVPNYCRYLQVTATPYCLYLQPDGCLNLDGNEVKPFEPRFTCMVPTHEKYVGGHEYFVLSENPTSMYSHLYRQIEDRCADVLRTEDRRYQTDGIVSSNIYGLAYAIVAYFMATAIRSLQEKIGGFDFRSSAVIHVEVDKRNHQWQHKVIKGLLEHIKAVILNDDQSDLRVWRAVDDAYADFEESNRKGREEGLVTFVVPERDEVLAVMREIFECKTKGYMLQMVNSDEEMAALLDSDTGELELKSTANVFIGGNILDRGVTIKNMLCFFYGRNPKTFQQDTVLQHARMYGARSKDDMAVTRFHTTGRIYNKMREMHSNDENLRGRIVAANKSGKRQDANAVFVGYGPDLKPCAASKIKVSNTISLKPGKRRLPVGFWTGNKSETEEAMAKIDAIVEEAASSGKDSLGFFLMNREKADEVLKLIESTYVYGPEYNNVDYKRDMMEMRCVLNHCAGESGGDVWVLYRPDRNINRIESNGSFGCSPVSGNDDARRAKARAVDAPVLVLTRQNGKVMKNDFGDNIGWNNAPFYWPVLFIQETLEPVMFAIDQKKKESKTPSYYDDFLEGYDRSAILSLTFKGDLEDRFGVEGTEYDESDCPGETRSITKGTSHRYLLKDDYGRLLINPEVEFDAEHDHGVYSYNGGNFPFLFKPYKYLCLRRGRDASADLMLLELFGTESWLVETVRKIGFGDYLIDCFTGKPLVCVTDYLVDRDLTQEYFDNMDICQWVFSFAVKRVVKFQAHVPLEATNVEDDDEDDDEE